MCGIFAYSGSRNAGKIILTGLKRLEYRGYDSWGMALHSNNCLHILKQVGSIGDLAKLKPLPFSQIGIGHTRWATHGNVIKTNAHPHLSSDRTFALVQNGIVENYQQLKTQLQKQGITFHTQTDTEVIVRQIEAELKQTQNLEIAIKKTFLQLRGRNTIAVLSQTGELFAIRHGSPLIVGLDKQGTILSSDTLSFANLTSKVIFIDDWQMVSVLNQQVHFFDLHTKQKILKQPTHLSVQDFKLSKNGHDSFYFKEVMEQPQTIQNAVLSSDKELYLFLQALKKAPHLYTLGAGSASYAAGVGAHYLRSQNRLSVTELKAYEIDSYLNLFQKNDILIVVSQSGETADTLEAVKKAKAIGVKIASIVNMLGSTLSRESDFPFFTRSGPEISVVSTKAFTAQITWFLLISHCLNQKERLFKKEVVSAAKKLCLYQQAKYQNGLKRLAKQLVKQQHLYILGHNELFYPACEAALKIKEISYLHAEAFSSGELKHGVIALIEKNTPVIGFIPNQNPEVTLNALYEVKARSAKIIGLAQENYDLFDYWLQTVNISSLQPIGHIIPIQLLGYYLAKLKHLSPDKPRNLAKSVTVK